MLCWLLHLFNTSDAVPPAVPDQLCASLDEALLFFALLVLDQLAFDLQKVFPSLARHLQAVALLVILCVNI